MFSDESTAMFFKTAKLCLEKDGARTVEMALTIEPLREPLTALVYDELRDHVFDEHGQIRPELKDVTIDPGLRLQRAAFRLDPKIDPEVTVEASVVKYQAKKVVEANGPDYVRLTVTIAFPLDTKQAREFVVNHFGHNVYVESAAIQAGLPTMSPRLGESPTVQ